MTGKLLFQILPSALLLVLAGGSLLGSLWLLYGCLRLKPMADLPRSWDPRPLMILMGLIFVASVLALAAIGFRLGWAGRTVPEWREGSPSALEPLLRKHCGPFLAAGNSTGLVAAVVRGDEVCLMGFGRPSVASSRVVDGRTLFEIGSITKTFTGLLLASEIERGRLRLDQPIRELLPGVPLSPGVQKVTLRHLITHTSGLPRLPGNEEEMLPGIVRMLIFGSDPYADISEMDYLTALEDLELEFPPGQQWEYSNFGVTLLGNLIARSAARDYEEMVKTDLCRFLGMKETTVNLSAQQEQDFARGYRALQKWGPLLFGLRSKPWDDARNLEAAGGLRSSGPDMLRYLLANMRPEESSLAAILREVRRELFRKDERSAVAMGWAKTQKRGMKAPLIWHNGGTGGFSSFVGFDETGQYGVMVMSNSRESVDLLAIKLLRGLVEVPRS